MIDDSIVRGPLRKIVQTSGGGCTEASTVSSPLLPTAAIGIDTSSRGELIVPAIV